MSNSEKPSNSLEIDSSFRNQLEPPRSIPLKLLCQTETTKRDSNKDGGDDQREKKFSILAYSMCLKRRGDGKKSCSKSLKRFANSPSPDRSVQKTIPAVQGLQVVPPLNRINSNPNPSLKSSPHQSSFHEPCSVPNLETRRAAVRAWANQLIAIADSEIFEVIEKEKQRQCRGIELIASENFVCQAVLEALVSHLTNKYSEGLLGARYSGGNHYIDQIELICCERALLAFHLDSGKWGFNVQPYSYTSANFAVYTGLLLPKDRIMCLDSPSGGHLSHGCCTPSGKKVSAASIFFESLPYKVNSQTGYIDYDKPEEKAIDYRPKILICGGNSYPREWDYGRFRKFADKCGAVLMCDMAHGSGLVAAQVTC